MSKEGAILSEEPISKDIVADVHKVELTVGDSVQTTRFASATAGLNGRLSRV
jgi:hypothetical protein